MVECIIERMATSTKLWPGGHGWARLAFDISRIKFARTKKKVRKGEGEPGDEANHDPHPELEGTTI